MRPASSLCHSFRLPCNVFNVPYPWRISATLYDMLQADYGFPIFIFFYSFIVSPILPTHQNLPVRLQRGPINWFPVPGSAEHVHQHACKSCSEFLGLGVYGDNCFPLQVVRPPTRRVSITRGQSRSVAKPGRPLPARCNVQRSRPAQHTGQRLWSPPPPPLALSPGLR